MKIEYKLVVKKNSNDSYEILEYNENKIELEQKANSLLEENPKWEVLVVKENYNVSWNYQIILNTF